MKFGIADFVSVALVVMKLTGVIDWTWAQVLCLPLIFVCWGAFQSIMEMIYENSQKKKEEVK
jgi:hypothetical protein